MIWIITVKKKKKNASKTNKTLLHLNNAWSWKNPKFVFVICICPSLTTQPPLPPRFQKNKSNLNLNRKKIGLCYLFSKTWWVINEFETKWSLAL